MAKAGREPQSAPDRSFAALLDRVRRQKPPRMALVMLNYLHEAGPKPAAEVRAFLNLSDRSVLRCENTLLDLNVLKIELKRGRQKFYALNLESDDLASAS